MAKLSYKEKTSLPKKDFAVKGKDGYNGKGKYPIPDEAHGRNALARVAQHGTSDQKAEVKEAVHRKFPEIKVDSKGNIRSKGGHSKESHATSDGTMIHHGRKK